MRVEYVIEKKDLERKFGALTQEDIAATLYNAFHGECICASHPFEWSDNGDFHGEVPWERMAYEEGDVVVQAFRLAAIAAYDALRSTGVGHLK